MAPVAAEANPEEGAGGGSQTRGMPTHRGDLGERGEKNPAKPLVRGVVQTREQAEEETGPSVPRSDREHPRPPAAPLKSPRASGERRGWGEVANISISEEVTCDPEGGSIVPLSRGTQTLVSLSA